MYKRQTLTCTVEAKEDINPGKVDIKIKPYKENVIKDLNKFNTGTKENDKYDIKESKGTALSNPNTCLSLIHIYGMVYQNVILCQMQIKY